MRTIRRIIKIHDIQGYKIYCLFNNGVSRVLDFKKIFKEWNVNEKAIEYPLVKSQKAFCQVELVNGTLVWKNIEIKSEDEEGQEVIYHYDLDPIVLYDLSEADMDRQTEIGLLIRTARKELGLTQQELAEKSGTSKHHISKIENNKSGLELSTLIRIIEGGLGKRLRIDII